MIRHLMMIAICLVVAMGCDRDGNGKSTAAEKKPEAPPPPSNRIDVPPAVRQNLGITFAKVERRRVASTVRVPGRFELLPSARREYRATMAGYVEALVSQYDQVQKGTPIVRLDAPEWHRLKKELHEAQADIEKAMATLTIAQQTKVEAEKSVEVIQKRIEALAGVEVRRAELEAELAARRNSIPRLEAEIKLKEAELNEARHHFALDLDAAASLLGVSTKFLMQPVEGDDPKDRDHQMQRWFGITRAELTSLDAGVVETIGVTNGAWVEANTLLASVINPKALRFRALGLQSDLGKLRDGLDVQIVPAQGSGVETQANVIPGKLKIGLTGDADQRTIELIVVPEKVLTWARPGVSAFLEIFTDDTKQPELAIPASAVIRDELTQIFFRRDPKNPDKVIRVEADLGINDGKWVVVNSGVTVGDEVVLDGVYELKLAGGGKATTGGHFHADGTWHADGTPEPK